MLVDKWARVYQAPGEVGSAAEGTGGDAAPPPVTETENEGAGSGRSDLRRQLEKGFDDSRKAQDREDRKARRKTAAPEPAEGEEVPPAEGEAPAEGDKQPDTAKALPAPEGFSKEAKAEWAQTPPNVQAAIVKRETDMAKGVEELKSRYSELENALQPHLEAIRRTGHTPGAAVAQLFAWFQALSGNPRVAFPALAQSFGYNLAELTQQAAQGQGQQAQGQGQQAQGQQPAGDIPAPVQQYINGLEQKLSGLEQALNQKIAGVESTFQQQSMAKTQEIMDNWAKDKSHFQEVRQLMAQFIASGAVPLKNGQADLDGAYQMAVYAHPEVRAKLMAEQQAAADQERKAKAEAARKAQTEQAAKARKAGVSLTGSAPGEPGAAGTGRPRGKGKSVRESIMEAREQLSE